MNFTFKNVSKEFASQHRRVAVITRAFLCEQQILLMDEPFSALDSQPRLIMQEELLSIWREFRQAVVYVTHDIEEAILFFDPAFPLFCP